jgi:uncharacterized membrane protein SpoIIM required for sporulation
MNDLFFQLSLICPSEEMMVLALSQVLRRRWAHSLPLTTRVFGYNIKLRHLAPAFAVMVPRAGWATLHAYISYTGPLLTVLVLVVSAFISGCIISYAAYNKKVESLLVAILIHFIFNASVIFSSAFLT